MAKNMTSKTTNKEDRHCGTSGCRAAADMENRTANRAASGHTKSCMNSETASDRAKNSTGKNTASDRVKDCRDAYNRTTDTY